MCLGEAFIRDPAWPEEVVWCLLAGSGISEVWLAGVGGRLSCSGYILICFNGTNGLGSERMVGTVL